ncbi:DUF3658 domain-containing protein [Methanofollis ethanolicus]|uniref:DUF3658 domain-containing protein n=1 Tax=Methanofollis ethanolicus TaxID=488124 RepID=UPI00082C2963|nr:DUF3658 domain-containing protein [Methanofollis ethanolicus]
MTDTINITFTESSAGALNAAGRPALALPDDLSLGPIDPYDLEAREAFFRALYAGTEYEARYADDLNAITAFWEETRPGTARRVVWLTRRSAREYAGFLEFLSREPDPCGIEVVDLTDGIDVLYEDEPDPGPDRIVPISLGELEPDWLAAQQDEGRALTPDEAEYYLRTWKQLKQDEDSQDVRTLWRGQLCHTVSATIPQAVLDAVPDEWTSAARVIGDALGALSMEYDQCGDAYLYSRLLGLVEMGWVEADGDTRAMHILQVRRAPTE